MDESEKSESTMFAHHFMSDIVVERVSGWDFSALFLGKQRCVRTRGMKHDDSLEMAKHKAL